MSEPQRWTRKEQCLLQQWQSVESFCAICWFFGEDRWKNWDQIVSDVSWRMCICLPEESMDGWNHDESVDWPGSHIMEEHEELRHCAIAHTWCLSGPHDGKHCELHPVTGHWCTCANWLMLEWTLNNGKAGCFRGMAQKLWRQRHQQESWLLNGSFAPSKTWVRRWAIIPGGRRVLSGWNLLNVSN